MQENRIENFIKNKKLLAFIITLQESFIAIMPFFLLTSFISLSYHFTSYLDVTLFGTDAKALQSFAQLLQSFTSLIAIISISYFFAIRFKVSQIIASILAITIYITITFNASYDSQALLNMPYGFTPNVIFLPILSTYLLKVLYPYFSFDISNDKENHHVYSLFNYILVFVIVYFLVLLLHTLMTVFLFTYIVRFNPLENNLPDILTLAIRNFMVEVSWFFGIHGEHLINGLFGKEILFKPLFENLSYGEFNRIFVMLGGAGIGLGLLVALLLYAKEKTIRTIAKISIPFGIFNINNLLIYAVVVFNRFLLIPFLLLPLANLLIAYAGLSLLNVSFTDYYVTWTTPSFVDSYLKSGGNMSVVFLQAILLVFDVTVYSYFVKKFLKSQSTHQHVTSLENNLNLNVELKSLANIESFKAQKDIIEANIKVEEIISDLNAKNLFVYYQPKVDIQNSTSTKFEALLRYKKNGILMGPIFLDTIEQAGLAHIIDIWVCTRVKENLNKWKEESYFPSISINLHPDTLKSYEAMQAISSMLEGEEVYFEIIERSFLFQSAQENLAMLQEKGFKLSIDDFGTGYSSLETIIKHDMDELKLDKSLIDVIHTKKGYLVCKHTSELCHNLNINVVAEGVETQEQLALTKEIGVDLVQGFYFSRAIPFKEVKAFQVK